MGYNKVTLYGNQICDYLYIQRNNTDLDKLNYVDAEPDIWNNNTILFSKYNKNLIAGNNSIFGRLDGYEIRRRKGANINSEYVATIKPSSNGSIRKFIIDYAISNKSNYTYYLYPALSSKDSTDKIISTPFITEEIESDWAYWALMVVDESDVENVYYLNKLFKFELNIEEDELTNNASISVIQNFTKHPTVQIGTSNYWSSGLSALCGFISCNGCDYIQTPNMIRELKSLSSETRKMFLKDPDGNIYEVKITSPINISTETAVVERIKTVKLNWAEVNDTSGVSIINNPDKSTIEWILTETGEVKPYVEYTWDEQYIWDDSYLWTANDGILDTETTNIGRDLFEEEGE